MATPETVILPMRVGMKNRDAAARQRFPVSLAFASLLVAAIGGPVSGATGDAGASETFLAANDDTSAPFPPSTASFYAIRRDGSLAASERVSTEGNGIAGGYFGTDRVLVAANGAGFCVFASNAQSESIAAFDGATHRLTGVFRGSHEDTSLARDGIGLAASRSRLYAAFSGSGNLGAFQIEAGCKLGFLGDVGVRGLSGGLAEGLAARGKMMVVAYGDGSIESFDISGRLPLSHNDAFYAAGRDDDFAPGAVDMTSDGNFAIFGGGSTSSQVAVADLSSGSLRGVTLYRLGTAWNSGSVRLSPDETMLYLSNSSGGRITAAFFDKASGKVRLGCTSDVLRGFYKKFTYIGAVATEMSKGSGGLLYVPEFNASGKSFIATLRFSSGAAGCTFHEMSESPLSAGQNSALLSVAVYPPRPF